MLSGKQEADMAFVTGEVVPTPGEESPYKVVFKQGDEVLAEWPVDSEKQGEDEIIDVLRGLPNA
jgi:hypothetical protein